MAPELKRDHQMPDFSNWLTLQSMNLLRANILATRMKEFGEQGARGGFSTKQVSPGGITQAESEDE